MSKEKDKSGVDSNLKSIVDAISNKPIDREIAIDAVSETLDNFDFQLKMFLVAFAKSKVERSMKLLEIIDMAEAELIMPERIENASTFELLKLYGKAQDVLETNLEFIGKVSSLKKDMVIDSSTVEGVVDDGDSEEVVVMDAPTRNKVRIIMSKLMSTIKDTDNNKDK